MRDLLPLHEQCAPRDPLEPAQPAHVGMCCPWGAAFGLAGTLCLALVCVGWASGRQRHELAGCMAWRDASAGLSTKTSIARSGSMWF